MIPDQRATPGHAQLDSHEDADKSQSEPTKTNQILEENNPIIFQITEPHTRTDIENQPKNRAPTKNPFKAK